MNNIIHSLTEVNRKVFFTIKKNIVKVVKATSAVDFNKNCIRENLLPKYISPKYISVYMGHLHQNGHIDGSINFI